MKIVLATANKGKIDEFKKLMPNDEVYAFEELIGKMDIIEDGDSFKANAVIKAQAIYDKLNDANAVVISDDSGVTVPVLNNEPGIYSARYAGESASDEQNNQKLISQLKSRNLKSTPAYYTACIAIIYKNEVYTVHGWMHGEVGDTQKGEGGFGYDPLFTPSGYSQTLGELPPEVKKSFSHRSQALTLAKKVLDVIL
ncbi:RdgB/HAM1 family non-canonical purine NTP pyrophosphatase [Candidatus Marinarcus aquaticus]|uniref:dITP/XTP pyrophosphatase n=1 Tax=Candidatus Marinarcus aquaticus TaxID=2044504 RepID=A0A4Q0XSQ5_9BACT|nr:RdgB/HAM1 family non-canonical purine NTP pyrophosphatase [Candidatus Marinarcus aquaticus]RXJ60547.1 non-canonical purine NTP pyrophosphatase, RdgB/HAM1 family [Candidatus Marinarcus aquaticus]